jgi:hypothetical protein
MDEAAQVARHIISTAIHHYLNVLQGRDGATLYDLAQALDGLVESYHQVPDVEPDTVEGLAAPRADEGPIFEAAQAAFPDLDWYALATPKNGPEQEVGMSMAVADLTEIAADLIEVLWLFENASHNDASWQFRFGYQSHWGWHLHEVRTYLHTLAAW